MQQRELFTEVWKSSLSSRTFTAVLALSFAALGILACVTSGRTIALEAAMMEHAESIEARTIIVTSSHPVSSLDHRLVEDLELLDSVESAVGCSAPVDVRNVHRPLGPTVASRTCAAGDDLRHRDDVINNEAARTLGVPTVTSVLLHPSGETSRAVVNDAPHVLRHFGSQVIHWKTPQSSQNHRHSSISILAASSSDVPGISRHVQSHLSPYEREATKVLQSETLREVSSTLGGAASAQARFMLAGVLVGAAAVSAIVVAGLVLANEKDLGRRRALGASRKDIVLLLLVRVAAVASCTEILVLPAYVLICTLLGAATPPVSFVLWLIAALVSIACLATLPVALKASFKDPVRVLRQS